MRSFVALSSPLRATLAARTAAAGPAASTSVLAASARRHYAHDSHAHHSSGPEEVFPEEGFSKPIWRNGALFAIALALAYRLAPDADSNATTHVEAEDHPITAYIKYQLTPKAGLWQERADKHLELAKEAADDKLLFQEAERPKVRRLRYLGTFDQASPNNVESGSQADLSDLVIKSEKDDFAFGRDVALSEDEDEE